MDEYGEGQVCMQTEEKLNFRVVWSNLQRQVQREIPSGPNWSEILAEEFLGQVNFLPLVES